jgi:hypothetical protein
MFGSREERFMREVFFCTAYSAHDFRFAPR